MPTTTTANPVARGLVAIAKPNARSTADVRKSMCCVALGVALIVWTISALMGAAGVSLCMATGTKLVGALRRNPACTCSSKVIVSIITPSLYWPCHQAPGLAHQQPTT